MTKQINVGFDGSATSSAAVQWAAAEASSRGARLRVISCYPTTFIVPPTFDVLTSDDAFIPVVAETHARLQVINAAVAETHPGLLVETVASSYAPESALIDGVSEDDLIVVGARSHSGEWLGTTARHVVRHSRCTLAVVPDSGSRSHTDRIVVGVDGSPSSRRALQWAGDEADRWGAKLIVVHAWMYPYMHTVPDSSQAWDLTRVDAACLLDREVEIAREQFAAEVDGRLIECGPATALLGLVRHGDTLVLGSKGHGAVHTMLFGSTVMTVLDRCKVPTVVVRNS